MHGVAVGFGIDGDGAQAHGAGGADDAAGDLAPVGDQQRAKTPVEFCAVHHRFLHHILNRPNFVGSIGALAAADNPRPSTSLVSAGSNHAVVPQPRGGVIGLPWLSYWARMGARNFSSSSADQVSPLASIPSRDLASTIDACSPPITEMRAFGHIQRKRGL
jgi:hypothetical protein